MHMRAQSYEMNIEITFSGISVSQVNIHIQNKSTELCVCEPKRKTRITECFSVLL